MFTSLRLGKTQPYTLLEDNTPTLSSRLRGYGAFLLQIWRETVILFLGVACTALILDRISARLDADSAALEQVKEYQLTSADHRWIQFQWTTDIYSSADPADSDAVNKAWEEIIPAFGFVAVDHGWAAEHHLPESMSLPSDRSKGVYIVDAYHQIHCLTVIRRTLQEVQSGREPTIPLQHSWHCFDSLLQYITCGTNGDTLLYTWGRNQTGDGQVRKCRGWKGRREWIQEHTACYRDSERPIPLIEHFTRCEGGVGDDGVRVQMF
ncbi:hypothetical protein BJX61DRAFT_411850 [Aspergillus egyptiacus]|nr:hypothetical protein BJX61DRAFT_411850 [Aspergillus egyptiacus]